MPTNYITRVRLTKYNRTPLKVLAHKYSNVSPKMCTDVQVLNKF